MKIAAWNCAASWQGRLIIGGLVTVLSFAAAVARDAPAPAASELAPSEFASAWSQSMKSRARLIAGVAGKDGSYLAGIQIVLTERTVTYWRTPGEAGTPPVVSFEGSTNLAKAQLEYPAPRRINEDGIEALGYFDEVIFPLRVTAADPSKPVALHIKLDYAACEKICIPVHAEADLMLPQGKAHANPFAAKVTAAEAKVPVRQVQGQATIPSISAVRGVSGDWAAGKGHFVVVARVAAGAEPVALFAEGPSGWYLQPAAAPGPRTAEGTVSISVDILQVPSGADIAKTPFVLTLVAGDRAVEVPVRLDSRNGAF